MRVLFCCTLAVSAALAGAADAATAFGQENPYSTASIGLTIVGAAILSLTALGSVGGLVAAVVVSLNRRADARLRRR